MNQGPKSSFEIAMERLQAADREAGVAETPLTEEQKAGIAEARRVAQARLAEREILFRDSLAKTWEPEARAKAEEEYRTDRRRIESDAEAAVEAIRRGTR